MPITLGQLLRIFTHFVMPGGGHFSNFIFLHPQPGAFTKFIFWGGDLFGVGAGDARCPKEVGFLFSLRNGKKCGNLNS